MTNRIKTDVDAADTLRLQIDEQALRHTDAAGVHRHQVQLLAALDAHDVQATRQLLRAAQGANLLFPVLNRPCDARKPHRELANAWTNNLLPWLKVDSPESVSLAAALMGCYAQSTDVAAAASLLGHLAGQSNQFLMAGGAFAVRASAGDPPMLQVLLDALSPEDRVQALVSENGSIFSQLMKSADNDPLMEDLLTHIIQSQDPYLTERLLRHNK